MAFCDVDAQHLQTVGQTRARARLYGDWRELLEKEGDRIDSVNVTVPDHMHFPIAHAAIARGRNLYCQKPMCHDVGEVRMLTEAAVRKGIVTQLGTQHASGIGDRMTVQLLSGGAIGKIKHVYLCSNREAPNRVKALARRKARPRRPISIGIIGSARHRCGRMCPTSITRQNGEAGRISAPVGARTWVAIFSTPPGGVCGSKRRRR